MSNEDEFIIIGGRRIPTDIHLEKIGKIKKNGEHAQIIVTKTQLKDDDFKLTNENLLSIVWNLKRFSSVTYIKRMRDITELFALGYEKYLAKLSPGEFHLELITRLYKAIAGIDECICKLLRNDKTAYAGLLNNFYFADWFGGRLLFEHMDEYKELGYRYNENAVGLFSYIDRACAMAGLIEKTLRSTWSFPSMFESEPLLKTPVTGDYKKVNKTTICKTDDPVPIVGIWNPFSYKSGCPNYFPGIEVAFPKVSIPIEKRETPEYWNTLLCVHKRVKTNYIFEECTSEWELLWEDTRYEDGTIPEEEAEYLDENTAFPSDPPEPPSM